MGPIRVSQEEFSGVSSDVIFFEIITKPMFLLMEHPVCFLIIIFRLTRAFQKYITLYSYFLFLALKSNYLILYFNFSQLAVFNVFLVVLFFKLQYYLLSAISIYRVLHRKTVHRRSHANFNTTLYYLPYSFQSKLVLGF